MYVCVHTWYLWRSEKDVGSPETGVRMVVNLNVGSKLKSSARTAVTLNHHLSSPYSHTVFSLEKFRNSPLIKVSSHISKVGY